MSILYTCCYKIFCYDFVNITKTATADINHFAKHGNRINLNLLAKKWDRNPIYAKKTGALSKILRSIFNCLLLGKFIIKMFFLEKFERFNQMASDLMEWIGVFAYLSIMVITCVNVIGAKLFNRPLTGSIDMVMLAQLLAISLSASKTLIEEKHIQVEFFVFKLSRRLQLIINCFVNFLGFILFLIISWRLFKFGYFFQIGGDETATAYIPLFPFVYLAAVSCIVMCLVFLNNLIKLIIKTIKVIRK